jgi:hypothetical protein
LRLKRRHGGENWKKRRKRRKRRKNKPIKRIRMKIWMKKKMNQRKFLSLLEKKLLHELKSSNLRRKTL